jgi:hypothetical protein
MTWDDVKRKLSSRKFWALLAVFVPSLLVFTGVIDVDRAETLKALIVMGGACVAYMFAESVVDTARIWKETDDGESDNDQ